jgi:hypothetical protein
MMTINETSIFEIETKDLWEVVLLSSIPAGRNEFGK